LTVVALIVDGPGLPMMTTAAMISAVTWRDA
jgi:hypothetical protein